MALDCATWRSISLTEADSSSAADAMSRTLSEASDGGRRRARGLGRRVVGGAGKLGRGGQHLIGNAAELGERRFHLGGEARDLGRHLLLTLRARLGVVDDRAVELFIVAHGALEHGDRARQRADLVAALGKGHRDLRVAGGDRFGHARDGADRLRHAARDDQQRRQPPACTAKAASRLSCIAVWSMPSSIRV